MTLMASETETYRWPPIYEPAVIVGLQREATPIGRRKLNISRSSSMGNPFVLKKHGGDCETAEEATDKCIKWLWSRLRDTNSKEYAWFESASDLMHSGQKLILGCCGDDHCHGLWIAHLLQTGDWRRWDTLILRTGATVPDCWPRTGKFTPFEEDGSADPNGKFSKAVWFLHWDEVPNPEAALLLFVLLRRTGRW